MSLTWLLGKAPEASSSSTHAAAQHRLLHVTGPRGQGCSRVMVWAAGIGHHEAAELACIPAASRQQTGPLHKGIGPLLCTGAKTISRSTSLWCLMWTVLLFILRE